LQAQIIDALLLLRDSGEQILVKKEIVRAVFDNNTWNDIVIRDSSDSTPWMLNRLQQRVVRGAVQVFVTTGLIEETIAYAETNPAQVRRRLAYLRVLEHGHLLRTPGEMMELEIRAESTEGRTFLGEEDESPLYDSILGVCDSGGTFVSSIDRQTVRASTLVAHAKIAERNAAKSVGQEGENEILTFLKQGCAEETQAIGATGDKPRFDLDSAMDNVLQIWSGAMIQQASNTFES
jgi:hypothetical protein